MDPPTRAQRQRAFAPKARTGCITCKKRHKKCDEEKPTCQRCKTGGYVCDGYETKTKQAPVKPRRDPLPLLAAKCIPAVGSLRKPLIQGNAMESNCYAYFFSEIIGHLEITPSLNRDFWHKTLLVPSQDSVCIRHAVLALGATYQQYSTGIGQHSTQSLDRFVMWHYNQAISQLAHVHGATPDLSALLTCCILFVILESLRGDFQEAIRHLESGIRILSSHRPKTYLPNGQIQELTAIFHAISSQVAIFSEDRIFPDVTHLLMPPKRKKKQIPGELRDLDEAEDVMNKFDDVINEISWDMDQDWDNEDSECVVQWSKLRQDVRDWKAQFEVLINKLTQRGHEIIHGERILNLRIQHKLWEVLLDGECNEDEADIDPTECNLLLDQIERLWCNPSNPRFGLKIDLTAALYQLYVYCVDDTVRHRIITMLRSQRRREIIWDSGDLADFLEKDMWQRAIGLQTERWPDIGPSRDEGALLVLRPRGTAFYHKIIMRLNNFLLTTMAALSSAVSTSRPKAVVYRGPASSPGCPEAIGNLLESSSSRFKVVYAGPNEPVDVTDETLQGAIVYAHGGGPNWEKAYRQTKRYQKTIRKFVNNGGHYMGFCLGAYLAGPNDGYGLLPRGVETDQEIVRRGAEVKDEDDAVIQVDWDFTSGKTDNKRWLYFQDGVVIKGLNGKTPGHVIGRYSSNGDVAASVTPYGKGWVGLVGPHPEADKTWYEDAEVENPEGIRHDIGHDFIQATLNGGYRNMKVREDKCSLI
ncbi:biotin ligase [Fusarium longipes]|uniref:Biotin ligase n=1 Tax=Fusarium longipes TaxID=694270 RepID=A0A395SYV3_9HYPO|nr:biotin ligase [Fusarium longipes]